MRTHKFQPDPDVPTFCKCGYHESHRIHGTLNPDALLDLYEACKRALPYLADHVALTPDQGPGDRIAYDRMEAAIAKAEDV